MLLTTDGETNLLDDKVQLPARAAAIVRRTASMRG
jgi:hypothetical protein